MGDGENNGVTRRDTLKHGGYAAGTLLASPFIDHGDDVSLATIKQELQQMEERITDDRIHCLDHPNSYSFSMEQARLDTPDIRERLQDGEEPDAVFDAVDGYALLHEQIDDKLEVPMFAEGVLDIDLIYLQDHDREFPVDTFASDVAETFQPYLNGIDVDVKPRMFVTEDREQTRDVLEDLYTGEKRHSDHPNSILQTYVFHYEDGLCGLSGVAPYDDNWAKMGLKGDCATEHRRGIKHEIGHAVGDLPHTRLDTGIMSYHPDANGTQELSTYSALLLQRYADSDLTVEQEGDALVAGFDPGSVPFEEATSAFTAHIDQYLRDYILDRVNSEQDWTHWTQDDVTVDKNEGLSTVTYTRTVDSATVEATIGVNDLEKTFSYCINR